VFKWFNKGRHPSCGYFYYFSKIIYYNIDRTANRVCHDYEV